MEGLNADAVNALIVRGCNEDAQIGIAVHTMNHLSVELDTFNKFLHNEEGKQ